MPMAKAKKRNIGKRVQEFRKARQMTQQSLAQAAELSVSLVAQIERGVNDDPRLSTLESLANALGVSIEKLLAEE